MKQVFKALIMGLLFISSGLMADDRSEDPIESRQNSMKALGKSMKALGPIYTQRVPYNIDIVLEAADNLVNLTDTITLLDSFPEGSLAEDSKSRSEIWDNWDEFENMMLDLEKSANDFKMVASMGLESSANEFENLTESCSVCHKKYRTKRKK